MPIYEYECEDGHRMEAMSKIATRKDSKECECGKTAEFVNSCPTVVLDGTDPGFPGAYSKFEKQHIKESKHTPSGNITHW